MDHTSQARSGFLFALSAFLIWGTLPFFWKLTAGLDPVEITAHRAFWAVPVAIILCVLIGRTADIMPTLKSAKKVGILFVCACLVSVNWGVFVWAIAVDRVLETALAYYINPLISILLGAIFLGEVVRISKALGSLRSFQFFCVTSTYLGRVRVENISVSHFPRFCDHSRHFRSFFFSVLTP